MSGAVITLESLGRMVKDLKGSLPIRQPNGTREQPFYVVLPAAAMKAMGLSEGDLVEVPGDGIVGGAGLPPRPLFSYFARVYTNAYIPEAPR